MCQTALLYPAISTKKSNTKYSSFHIYIDINREENLILIYKYKKERGSKYNLIKRK